MEMVVAISAPLRILLLVKELITLQSIRMFARIAVEMEHSIRQDLIRKNATIKTRLMETVVAVNAPLRILLSAKELTPALIIKTNAFHAMGTEL